MRITASRTHKKTKTGDGKYQYRGFAVWKHPTAGCWEIFVGSPRRYVSQDLKLDAALGLIDAWYHAADIGSKVLPRFADAVDLAKRLACESGEPVACPDAQTCRHGIDN